MPKELFALKMRAVQLDLARQMETPDFICEFIDFISQYDYNTLFLYLEGRIRTASFPYPAENESYSPDEMKRVVDYATSKNIEIVPALSTLGHAEKFLKYPEMAHLSELDGDIPGRFGATGANTFCATLPEVFEFFDKYFGELAEIFPSDYFHAGLDEDWNIGFCELCRARAESEEGQSGIFAQHVISTHAILAKYGKRMIMWDDMFEFYTEALEIAPRDIIMCCWHYDSLVDIPKAHFANRRRENLLAQYEKMGFETIIAPSDWTTRNIETFTEYAKPYNVLGGLVTTWEKSRIFQWHSYSIMAFAGRLWNNTSGKSADEIITECLTEIFGIDDPMFINACKTFAIAKNDRSGAMKPYLNSQTTEMELERTRMFINIRDILETFKDRVKGAIGKNVIEDSLDMIKCNIFNAKLNECLRKIASPAIKGKQQKQTEKELDHLLDELSEIRKCFKSKWDRFRNGITPCCTDIFYDSLENDIQEFREKIKKGNIGLLHVRFILPDMYSAQTTAIYVKYRDQDEWIKITEGVYKAFMTREACYSYSFPAPGDIPEAVRIETWGYGGQGFNYLELETADATYIPTAITNASGQIISSENILIDDLQWCFMGERDTTRAFFMPQLAQAKHCIELTLTPHSE